MTEANVMRDKLNQWREREKERASKLRDLRISLAQIRALNNAQEIKPRKWSPLEAKQSNPSITESVPNSQSSEKENSVNGSQDLPSKKRRLMDFPPSRSSQEMISNDNDAHTISTNNTKESQSSNTSQDLLYQKLHVVEAKFEAVLAENATQAARYELQERQLRRLHEEQLHSMTKSHEEQMKSLAKVHEAALKALSERNAHLEQEARTKCELHKASLKLLSERNAHLSQEAETKERLHEVEMKELSTKLHDATSKLTAIKEEFDVHCCPHAGTDLTRLLDEVEEQIMLDLGDAQAAVSMLADLKKKLRQYAIWVKSHDDDLTTLQFSNQVYLQQINHLQQKVLALQREVTTLNERNARMEQEAADARQDLLDEVEQMNLTVVPALEKAMKQNQQLREEIAELRASSAAASS
ncbi:hypothetical protein AeRB84_002308 [Aphanomyces euteiches]|nr:hypothetical protein AeRB84_002308 [Aphanomyces euteiches]